VRWFRDTIKRGSWLALLALAANLVLSFGHIHSIDGKASGRRIAAMATAVALAGHDRKQGHPTDDHDYLCPICMAAIAMANALASSPPEALPVDFANVTIDRSIVPVLALVEPPRAAFRSRGPPTV
jgi:hypothetical protein